MPIRRLSSLILIVVLTFACSIMLAINTSQAGYAAVTSSTVPLASTPSDVVDAGTKAYVLNADNITVINTVTNAVIGTITPASPLAASYFAFGVYVPSDASLWVTRYTESGGNVIRINTADDTITDTFTSSVAGPSGITASATKIYVAMRFYPAKIAVFDIASKTRESNLNYTGAAPVNDPNYSTNFSPYILNIVGDTLFIFQGNSSYVVPWTISTGTQGAAFGTGVGAGASYTAVNPAGTYLYVGNGTTVRKILVGTTTNSAVISGLTNTRGVAFSRDGSKVFVTANPNLLVLDAATQSQIGQQPTGLTDGIAVVDSGRYLYIGLTPTNQLFQVDIDPTLTSSSTSLNVNVSSSISAPISSAFWTNPTYTSTTLPPGLTLDPNTGVISGTPTVAQQATNVTLTATTTMFTRTSTFAITVIDPNAPTPTPTPTVTPTPSVSPANNLQTPLARTGTDIAPVIFSGTAFLLSGVVILLIVLREQRHQR